MENDKNNDNKTGKSKFIAYVTGKGFYKIIGLCVGIAVLSAWFLASRSNAGTGITLKTSTPASAAAASSGAPAALTYESGLSTQILEGRSEAPAVTVDSAASVPAETVSDGTAAVNAPAVSEDATLAVDGELLFVLPVSGEILRGFSNSLPVYSPTFADWRVHNGLDIAAEIGTPVRAMAAGVVSDISTSTLWGTCVTITHADGYVSTYCNLGSKPTVKVDSLVDVGQVIGSVGNGAQAEAADEPHLHLILTCDGVAVDAQAVVATMAAQ